MWGRRKRRRRGNRYRMRLTGAHWTGVCGFALTAVIVAAGLGAPGEPGSGVPSGRVAQARHELAALAVLPERPPHDAGYQREEFGTAWTDAAPIAGGGNGCDTRNDILARDLASVSTTVTPSCPVAVAQGTLRSPYTGRRVDFQRGKTSAAVQIDHIVPLSYAWDMGARAWPVTLRMQFANDPANLVAVDGASNQRKGDSEPARWMPALRSFHCAYAVQFVTVLHAYRLPVDAPSRHALGSALGQC